MITKQQRKKGALLGAIIGDALALGPHWYYDLEAMRRDYGPWVSDYTEPQKDRYHGGMKAGEVSQAGILMALTADSLRRCKGYDHDDFCQAFQGFLEGLNGEAMGGPGGYTSQSIRETYQRRIVERMSWEKTGGTVDTTEAIERTIPLALVYSHEPSVLAEHLLRNTRLTQIDETVQSLTLAYIQVLADLLNGNPLDSDISSRLMSLAKSGKLPFHTVTSDNLQPPKGDSKDRVTTSFASPDSLLSPGFMVRAAGDPEIRIEPAWKVSLVYGMPCAIYHQLPAAYYLAARFQSDFESAVLHAVNGGGQNQSRAILTGALVGAQVGLDGIPKRFLEGLVEKDRWLQMAEELAGITSAASP